MISESVDVLITDLEAVDVDEELLSVAELGRAIELASSPELQHFLAAGTWMRRQLAAYLVAHPAEIALEADERGIPVVVSPETDLSFSLSYSDWVGMLAIGFGMDVGVAIVPLPGTGPTSGLTSVARREAMIRATGSGQVSPTTDLRGPSPLFVKGFAVTDIQIGDGLVAAVASPWGTTVNLIVDDTTVKSMARPTADV